MAGVIMKFATLKGSGSLCGELTQIKYEPSWKKFSKCEGFAVSKLVLEYCGGVNK